VVATTLTLVFLPALYVAWFRVKEPERAQWANAQHDFTAINPATGLLAGLRHEESSAQ
jgi:hypothetical protein